mmetsp:Transcript_11784/g.26197  ORF Transcript_11784/g.26197 Transcript_11784/m.26197 type:complete len:265 (+) Transcript_11784:1625-2419(+)
MPKLSISSSSVAFLLMLGSRGIAVGQTVYTCAASTAPMSLCSAATIASMCANGNPSPRCPLNPSACTRTMTLLQSKSTKYRLPLAISLVYSVFPFLIMSSICPSSCRACAMAAETSWATLRILSMSSDNVLIFPFTTFFIPSRLLAMGLDLSNGSTDALNCFNCATNFSARRRYSVAARAASATLCSAACASSRWACSWALWASSFSCCFASSAARRSRSSWACRAASCRSLTCATRCASASSSCRRCFSRRRLLSACSWSMST